MLPRSAKFIAILALVVVACSGCDADESAPVDPELYRVEIEGLDALVFSHLPLNEGLRNVTSMAFGDLSDKFAALERERGAGGRVSAFRRLSKQVRRGDLPQVDLRHDWLTLRNEVFIRADWFRYVDPATGRSLPRPPRPVDLAAAQRVLENLESLIGKALHDVAGLGKLHPGGRRERENLVYLQAWKAWAEAWPGAIAEAMQELPEAPGPGADLNYQVAHTRLGHAAVNLEAVISTNWALPFQPLTDEHFAVVRIHLDAARESLQALGANADRPPMRSR